MAVKKKTITNKKSTTGKKKSTASKKTKKDKSWIYGIYIDDELQYIGSSENIENRWVRHKEDLLKGKHSNKTLTKVWNDSKQKKLEFKILVEIPVINSLVKFFTEMLMISYFDTKCSRAVIQVRSVRLCLAKCDKELARRLLEVIFDFYKCDHVEL